MGEKPRTIFWKAQYEQAQKENAQLRTELEAAKEERAKSQGWVNYHNISVILQKLKAENKRLKDKLKSAMCSKTSREFLDYLDGIKAKQALKGDNEKSDNEKTL
jgi:hypothetical protein